MSAWTRVIYLVLLVTGVLVDAAILYFPMGAGLRLTIGLLLLPVIVLPGIRLEVSDALGSNARWESRGRVFRELRSQVGLFLEQVRRLNWVAVDAERGFRDKEEAMREMDKIEAVMREIITDVRNAAGRPTPEPTVTPVGEAEAVG